MTFCVRPASNNLGVDEVVTQLLGDVKGKWHRVYADNLFISTRNLLWAKDNGIYLVGTARTNRGFPDPISRERGRPLEEDEWTWVMTEEGLSAVAWHDTTVAQFMSNWHDPEEPSSVERRERGVHGRTVRAAPKVARDYNMYMGGVDQLDSLRGSCTCAVKYQKWWHALFWWMLDTAMVNAYRAYCFEAKGTPMDRATFILSVVNDLLGGEHQRDVIDVLSAGHVGQPETREFRRGGIL